MTFDWRAVFQRYKNLSFPKKGRIRFGAFLLACLVLVLVTYKSCRNASGGADRKKKNTACDYPWKAADISCYLAQKSFDTTLHAVDTIIRDHDTLTVTLTIDDALQRKLWTLMRRYRPRCGAAVVMRPATGEVLAAVSYRNDADSAYLPRESNMLLWNGYPAASLIKIVTASDAMEQGLLRPDDALSVSGSFYTLYRFQLKDTPTRWSRKVTMREGFARSINPLFAKIGVNLLGADRLNAAADRFCFNRPIAFDMPVPASRWTPPCDEFETAEAACGFNRSTTLTPFHAAMLAGAVCNDGTVTGPYLVKSAGRGGETLYRHGTDTTYSFFSVTTAGVLRDMMNDVIVKGTARKGFRELERLPCCRSLEIGGKTGSLDADNPKGRCDWFAGFAREPGCDNGDRIAVAVITVHGAFWTVHSSYIAAEAIRVYFDKKRRKAAGGQSLDNGEIRSPKRS